MRVGDRAIAAIIRFEVSSPAYYMQRLSRPVLPGGASGITIGIGYDLGQHTADEIKADWSGVLDTGTIAVLAAVAGLQGDAARARLPTVRDAVVPYAAAALVFSGKSLPSYAAQVEAVLPNCDALPPDAFGALVSLAYNRGAGGFDLDDDRHAEMADIKDAMTAKDFAAIPGSIRDMKRLWTDGNGDPLPGMAGVVARRDDEAALFENALAAAARTEATA